MAAKYSSSCLTCIRYALRRFGKKRGAIPYVIKNRRGGYHVVTLVGSLYYDKFGARSLRIILADLSRVWRMRKLRVQRTSWDFLRLILANEAYEALEDWS